MGCGASKANLENHPEVVNVKDEDGESLPDEAPRAVAEKDAFGNSLALQPAVKVMKVTPKAAAPPLPAQTDVKSFGDVDDFDSDPAAARALTKPASSARQQEPAGEFGYHLENGSTLRQVGTQKGKGAEAFGRDLRWLESNGVESTSGDNDTAHDGQSGMNGHHGHVDTVGGFQRLTVEDEVAGPQPSNPLATPSPPTTMQQPSNVTPVMAMSESPLPKNARFSNIEEHEPSPGRSHGPPIDPNDPWAGLQAEYQIGVTSQSLDDDNVRFPPINPSHGRGQQKRPSATGEEEELVLDDEAGDDADFEAVIQAANKKKKKTSARVNGGGNWGDGDMAAPGTLMLGEDKTAVPVIQDPIDDEDDLDDVYDAGTGGDGLEDNDLEAPPADDLGMEDIDDFEAEMQLVGNGGMDRGLAAKLQAFEGANGYDDDY